MMQRKQEEALRTGRKEEKATYRNMCQPETWATTDSITPDHTWNTSAKPAEANLPALLFASATTRSQSAVRNSLPNEGSGEIKANEAIQTNPKNGKGKARKDNMPGVPKNWQRAKVAKPACVYCKTSQHLIKNCPLRQEVDRRVCTSTSRINNILIRKLGLETRPYFDQDLHLANTIQADSEVKAAYMAGIKDRKSVV